MALSNVGGYNLNYAAGIEYLRDSVLTSSLAKTTGLSLPSNITPPALVPVMASMSPKELNTGNESFNRVLVHDTATLPVNMVGYGGSRVFYTATGFYAPSEGFNLTHVQTWYTPGDWLNSKVKVDIWSGDEDINSSKIVYSETFNNNTLEPDLDGKLLTLKLSQNVEFYPNEKFYVAFGYEAAVNNPQGVVNIDNSIPNRYMYGSGSDWDDLSNYSQFKELGWMVRAAEETATSTPWVVLSSNETGSITTSDSDTLQLDFNARSVKNKNNYAKLLIRSNDVKTPVKEVILHLAKNQGPVFKPFDGVLNVAENDILKFSVSVKDLEDDYFDLVIDSSYKYLENVSGKKTLIKSTGEDIPWQFMDLVYSPDFQGQGMHTISFTATDEFGYTGKFAVTIDVANVNRPPVALPMDTVRLRPAESFKVLSPADLFTDPDNDIHAISAVSNNTDVINVFASENYYLLPMANGKSHITFVATDLYGAVTTNIVQVVVDETITGFEPKMTDEFHVYPNRTNDFVITKVRV